MSKVGIQQYIKTIRLEEKNEIERFLKSIEQKCPEVTLGMASDIGKRENQQDSSFGQIDGSLGFGVVCDGMGGMEGGEYASRTAVDILVSDYYELKEKVNIKDFFREEAYKMNRAVCNLKSADGKKMNAGTTIVATQILSGKLEWMSIGDSRIYIVRDHEIFFVNQEHNYRMRMDEDLRNGKITIEEYEEEESRAEALISFLGVGDLKLIDMNEEPFQLKDKDTVLLCSDGLYKTLADDLIQGLIQDALPNTQLAAKRLIDAVMEKKVKEQDNVSVVLLQYHI